MFTLERTYNAPVSKVWQALTDKDQMKKWYFDLAAFKAEPGFEFQFDGKGKEGQLYVHLCKVVEVIPEKKLSHTWTYKGLPGMSTVTWELFSEGGKTRVKLTHEGLESFAVNGPDFMLESFTAGWTHILGKGLKEFVEA